MGAIAAGVACGLALSGSSLAAEARFRVVNVPPGDTLFLRAAPDYRSSKIGDIARSETRVTGLGQTASSRGGRWMKVSAYGKRGWVNARFLTPYASRQAKPQPISADLDCSGDKPFWTLRADKQAVRLRDSRENTRIWDAAGAASPVRNGGWSLRGAPSHVQPTVTEAFLGTLREGGRCASAGPEGLSALAIEFSLGGAKFSGCCTKIASKRSS
jgi:uncharacterized membrane protein